MMTVLWTDGPCADPQGAIFLFFAGRTEEMKGNIDKVRLSSTKLDLLLHARLNPL